MTKPRDKKQFERWVIKQFVSIIPEIASTNVVNYERPDFLLRTEAATIGLELTGLIDETLAERDTAQQQVIARCKELYDKQGLPPVHANLMFINHRFPRTRDVDAIARQVVRAIASHMPPMNEHLTIRHNYSHHRDNSGLPPHISLISLGRYHVLDHSFFGRMDGGFARLITPRLVQEKISIKNRRIGVYLSRCTAAWLVIAYDTGGMKSLFKLTQLVSVTEYESNFSRVFLFNCFAKVATELMTKKAPNQRSTLAAALGTVRLRRPEPAAPRSGQLVIGGQ